MVECIKIIYSLSAHNFEIVFYYIIGNIPPGTRVYDSLVCKV